MAAALVVTAGGVVAVAHDPHSGQDVDRGAALGPPSWTKLRCAPPFGAGAWPGACWRPYSRASPFNQRLPRKVRVARGSAAAVAWLRAEGGPAELVLGTADTDEDWEHPVYWSRRSDPVFTVRCLQHEWGRCKIEGLRVRIPDAARPAGGGDGHLAVVDQAHGREYDFWQVRSKPRGGGVLKASWGGWTRIERRGSDGLGSDATAAHFGLLAGIIRAPELAAGRIDHALFMRVECDSGRFSSPAFGRGSPCSHSIGAPDQGARFQLAMTEREIDALRPPRWKRAILLAMSRYGIFVGDTGAEPWEVGLESGSSYTSFGRPDPWVRFAREQGIRPDSEGRYNLDFGGGVAWYRRLRVVDPCVSRRTCR